MGDPRVQANPWIPKSNSSRYGAPQTSQFGQAVTQNAIKAYGQITVLTRSNLLNPGFSGRVAIAPPGTVATIFAPGGYRGILPLSKQPLIQKPRPYDVKR